MHTFLRSIHLLLAVAIAVTLCWSVRAQQQQQQAEPATVSNSLLAQQLAGASQPEGGNYHALRATSQFAITPPQPRAFAMHDLVQIIVKEVSDARSSQSLETERTWDLAATIAKFPSFTLPQLLELQLANSTSTPINLDIQADRAFEGDGEYERRDDLSARLTAEVIELLPNGNLVLEARTSIRTDEEVSTIKVTGVCRPQDVTAVNTVLSNQLHDLVVEKMHEGELRDSTEKGLLARVFEFIFAF